MKGCSRCKTDKPLDAFNKDKGRRDGLNAWCRQCFKDYNSANPRKQRARALRHKYGLSWDQFEELLARSGGTCSVCDASDDLVVDHCHDSGRVRGILCRQCNIALGAAQDNPEILQGLVAYLAASD